MSDPPIPAEQAHRRGPRHGFRAQLALLIAVTISLSGVAVLGALYLVVAKQLNVVVQASPAAAAPQQSVATGPAESPHPPTGNGHSVTIDGTKVDVGSATSAQVLRPTLLWLGAIVLVLTVVSTALGWWLSGRLLRRVAEITRTAREVADGDLSARLALPGPRDEITELGDTIDTMLERLDDAMTAQRLFVSNASHELRTPLASGRLALEAPLAQGLLQAEGAVAAERALRSIERASTTLAALLTLATTTESSEGSRSLVDLGSLAQQAIADEQDLLDARRQIVTGSLEPARTMADPDLLARAVHNLVRNAVIHSPERSALEITSTTGAGEAQLVVSNPGAMLDAGDVASLTEPFHRGANSRLSGTEGSGLGLTIVAAIVRRHGGSLDLAPRPGGGLTVSVSFPTPAQPATHS